MVILTGMIIRDIQTTLLELYHVEVSHSLISKVTDASFGSMVSSSVSVSFTNQWTENAEGSLSFSIVND